MILLAFPKNDMKNGKILRQLVNLVHLVNRKQLDARYASGSDTQHALLVLFCVSAAPCLNLLNYSLSLCVYFEHAADLGTTNSSKASKPRITSGDCCAQGGVCAVSLKTLARVWQCVANRVVKHCGTGRVCS